MELMGRKAAETDQKEEEDEQPWWQKGLGAVIGNPVVQTALKPLEVLDHGRRAVTLGLEEFAEGLSGEEFASQLNDDGSLKDTRSNMDKLKDPRYGFGELMGDTWDDSLPGGKSNYYANALGFVGDVAFDPLTWTTGLGGAATKAGTSINKATRVGMAAKALDATGDVDAVRRFVTKGVQAVDDDFLETLRKAGVGDIQRSQVRFGRRGAVKGKDGVARRTSVEVPGLSKISEAASKYSGEAANAFRQTKLSRALQPGVEGLEDATNVLLRGGGDMSFAGAADKVAIANFERRVTKSFKSVANDSFIGLRRQLKRESPQNQRAILESIERGFETDLADFGEISAKLAPLRDQYADAYKALRINAGNAGLPVQMRSRYVPHILTRDAAAWMRNGGDDTLAIGRETQLAKDPTGIFTRDMYDPSGVTMARQFTKETSFDLSNNKRVDFSDIAGDSPTIHEVNEKLREAGLDFDYFETSPDIILTKYVDMLSSDVGATAALKSRVGSQSVAQMSDTDKRLLGMVDDAGAEVPEAQRVAASATVLDRTADGRKSAATDIDALRAQNNAAVAPDEASLVTTGVNRDATTKLNQDKAQWVTDVSSRRAEQIKGESAAARSKIDDLGEESADVADWFADDLVRQSEAPMPDAKVALGESRTELKAAVGKTKAAVRKYQSLITERKRKITGPGPKAALRREASYDGVTKATKELDDARDALAMMDGYLDESLDGVYRAETSRLRTQARKEINVEKAKLQKAIKEMERDLRSETGRIASRQAIPPQIQFELDEINKALKGSVPKENRIRLEAKKRRIEEGIAVFREQKTREVQVAARGDIEKLQEGIDSATPSNVGAPIDEAARDASVAKAVEPIEKFVGPTRRGYGRAEAAADKRITKLQEAMGEEAIDSENISEAFGSVYGARAVEKEAADAVAANAELVDRIAAAITEAQEAASVIKGAAFKPPRVKNLDALEVEVARHIDEMGAVLADNDLGSVSKLMIEVNQTNMLERLKQIKSNDLTQAKYSKMKGDGNFGRIVVAQIDDNWAQGVKHLAGDDILLSKELANARKIVVEATQDGRFWQSIDSLTSLFKTYATMTPGFHVRNAMSATFMNATEGIPFAVQREGWSLMTQYKRQANKAEWLAKQDKEVRGAFEAMFGSGVGGQFAERGVGSRGSAFSQGTEWMFENRATKASAWMGGVVEASVRLPVALHTLRSGGDVAEAMQRVTRTHFDYSQASKLDQKMKRLIPFWTFMSRNLPLQLTQMYMKPSAYAKYNSFVRNFSVPDEEGTPEYFEGVGAFNTGLQLGSLPLYLQPDLAHTRLTEDIGNIEAMSNLDFGKILSSANPLLTAPIEFTTGKDIFTGRQYDETDRRLTGTAEKPIELLARFFNQGKDTPEGNFAVDEKFINAIRGVVPLYDRAVRLTPGAVTGNKSEDSSDRQIESILRFLGAPVRQLSPGQQRSTLMSKYYDDLDKQREMRSLAELDN
jgi:hypothetical protein